MPLGTAEFLNCRFLKHKSICGPSGQVMSKAQNRQTYKLTKWRDGWKVAHFHNVRVDADAAKHDPFNSPKK